MNELAHQSGLNPAVIDKINSVFFQYPQIAEVVLYGSRAKGNYRPGSDIDLAIKGKNLGFSQLLEIEQALDELLLPYHIDLSLFDTIDNHELISHIQRTGLRFYPR